jgi:hypothetical protein
MLALAGAREAYVAFAVQDMTQRFQWPDAHFAGFICIGCFGPVMDDLTESGAWHIVKRTRTFRPYVAGEAELLTNLFAVEVLVPKGPTDRPPRRGIRTISVTISVGKSPYPTT